MKYRLPTDIIVALVMVIATIAVGNPTIGRSADPKVARVSSRGETAPIVLAQYNPCPNGHCR